MHCCHFQVGIVYSKRGLVGWWLLSSLRNTSKWQNLGSLLANPISPVHQGASRILTKKTKKKKTAKQQIPFQPEMSTRTQLNSHPWEHNIMRKKINKKIS